MDSRSVIFDLDGTLWDSTASTYLTFRAVLREFGFDEDRLTEEELIGYMGRTTDELGGIIFPELEREKQLELMNTWSNRETEYLYENGAVLFDGLEQTLMELTKRYKLYIVSNCHNGYIEAFLHAHHLEAYFCDYELWERTGKTKGENILLLMQRNHIRHAVYVGDTAIDREAAEYAGIPFIHAGYGFGRLTDCPYEIDSFAELPRELEKVFQEFEQN